MGTRIKKIFIVIIILILILFGVYYIGSLLGYFPHISTFIKTDNLLAIIEDNLFAIIEIAVLLLIGIGGWMQLKTIRKQNELSRIVSWKSSLQEVNKLIFAHPDRFIPIFYPHMTEEELLKITGAYTSLNAMETIYHMRKDEKDEEQMKRLRAYLEAYLSDNQAIIDMWSIEEYHDAFTREFQDEVNQILPKASQTK